MLAAIPPSIHPFCYPFSRAAGGGGGGGSGGGVGSLEPIPDYTSQSGRTTRAPVEL